MFKPNQKVVCITNEFSNVRGFDGKPQKDVTPNPKKGEVCTVDKSTIWNGQEVIQLKEYHPNDWFAAHSFKPAVDDSSATFEQLMSVLPFHEYQTVEVHEIKPNPFKRMHL